MSDLGYCNNSPISLLFYKNRLTSFVVAQKLCRKYSSALDSFLQHTRQSDFQSKYQCTLLWVYLFNSLTRYAAKSLASLHHISYSLIVWITFERMTKKLIFTNKEIAEALERISSLLEVQGASNFRVRAYTNAASTASSMKIPLTEVLESEGISGLIALPNIGKSIACTIIKTH